jgi:hypothetical protein
MPANRYYVGHKFGNQDREVFTSDHTPTKADKLPYSYVTGPFVTKRGAVWASQPGAWFATIAEAERHAKSEYLTARLLWNLARTSKGANS